MMADNPLDIVDRLRYRLRKLAKDAAPLRSEEGFRDAFEQMVDTVDLVPRVLFECRPPFVRLESVDLENGAGKPSLRILEAIQGANEGDAWRVFQRPYRHQVEAFHACAGRNKSLVVATGTASGKTESMALPILNDILERRSTGGHGGTQALFVFPLNALATDQRERLESLAKPLGVSVGTMNGLTPSSEKRRLRETPPDVLITNFTMLEYMLLRPADKRLLGLALRYIALDEAHVYRGALGRDMGLLLHRLRLHVEQEGGHPEQLCALLASATLGGTPQESFRFASELTGVESANFELIQPTFDLEHLEELPSKVRAVVEPLVRDLPRLPEDARWTQVTPRKSSVRTEREGEATDAGAVSLRAEVHAAISRWIQAPRDSWLASWQLKVHALAHGLGGVLVDLPSGSDAAFGQMHQEEHLEDSASDARELEPVGRDGKPLYRLVACDRCGMPFLFGYLHERGGEDFLCTEPPPVAEDGTVRSLFLAWPTLLEEEGESAKQLAATQLEVDTRRLRGPDVRGNQGMRRFLVVEDPDPTGLWDASNLKTCPACDARDPRGSVTTDFVTDSEDATSELGKELLDAQVDAKLAGGHTDQQILDELFPTGARVERQVPKLLTFSDTRRDAARFGPIIESFQFRQWLFARMSLVLDARRQLHVRDGVLDGLVLEKLVDDVCDGMSASLSSFFEPVVLGDEARAPKYEVEFELLRLFGKRMRRSDRGERTGLATVYPPPAAMKEWIRTSGLPQEIARGLFLHLLDEARYDMLWCKGHRVAGDDGFPVGQNLKRCFAGVEDSSDDESMPTWIRWIRGTETRETKLDRSVKSLLTAASAESRMDSILQSLWACWCETGVLKREELRARRQGYALDWKELRFQEPLSFRRCGACGYVTAADRWCIDRCLICGVEGSGAEGPRYSAAPADRYLFSAVEHTAQWRNDASQRIMQAFKHGAGGSDDKIHGPIHLLSSSTTYEVGVDLGDLSHVLLRNLPASSASFVQRIGRAGRREGQAALSVTYLRPFATDRVVLLSPERWLEVRPPTVKRDVPVMVQRHVRAALLSWAIRRCDLAGFGEDEADAVSRDVAAPPNLTMAHFYVDASHVDRVAPSKTRDKIREWLAEHSQQLRRDGYTAVSEMLSRAPNDLYDSIRKHITADLHGEPWSLEDMVQDVRDRLAEHKAHFEKQCEFYYRQVEQVMALSGDARRSTLEMLRRQIAEPYRLARPAGLWQQMVIPEWAKAGVTPAYAFPIHPLKLHVRSRRGRLLELERDATLGLGEYVPGAHVTAGARVYQSQGIQLASPPTAEAEGVAEWGIALGAEWCVYCARCGHLMIEKDRETLVTRYGNRQCPGCQGSLEIPAEYSSPKLTKRSRRSMLDAPSLGSTLNLFPVVKPHGFVTRDDGARVFARQPSVPAQPPRWLPQGEYEVATQGVQGWSVNYRLLESQRIAVLNLGRYNQRGFRLCPNTGLDLDLFHRKDDMKDGSVPWFDKLKVPVMPSPDCVALFTDFATDVLVLEPSGEGPGKAWEDEIDAMSVMTALLVVAPNALQAERREVGGLLYPAKRPAGGVTRQVVLYDNVHGGAGLMRELAQALHGPTGVLSRALELVEECGCRRSCPNCLKLPWNQREQGSLDRIRAAAWLRAARNDHAVESSASTKSEEVTGCGRR